MSGVGDGWWLGYDWASGELAPVLDAPNPRTLAYDTDLDARFRAERSERGCDRRFYQRAFDYQSDRHCAKTRPGADKMQLASIYVDE